MSKALEIAKYLVNPDYPVTYTKCLDAAAELRNQDAEIKRLRELNAELVAALALANRMNKEALPKFNWGASFLDANAIQLLNEAPLAVGRALDSAKEQA